MSTSTRPGDSPPGGSPADIDGLDALTKLSLDLRWAWNHATDAIWRELDPALWEQTHNPGAVLRTASRDTLQRALSTPAFREKIDALMRSNAAASAEPAWFQRAHPGGPLTCVAYFSMEFMLSEALPIYSGGLGNVAGDQLKAASDLGVPVVGVGLLYQRGYFRQVIDSEGEQQALYPSNDPGQLPITPLRRPDGEWLRLEIAMPGGSAWIRAWEVQVGKVKLYLLDSNDPANAPSHRAITSELYGGGPELRLQQEMLLGLGGWRLLRALGLEPEVCHLNEGHAAFAVLERARNFMAETGQPFDVALAATRAGNVFTTHTAVAAGFDRFPPSLVEHYLGGYAEQSLGITLGQLLALGRQRASDDSEPFNMAYLAVRGSGAVNGVSRLHGKVSRHLFEPLFPRWPEDEVPIGHVTNGVHTPSWDSAAADALWTNTCGKERWLGTAEDLERRIRGIPDADLWRLRQAGSESFVAYVRERAAGQLTASGAAPAEITAAKRRFDPAALTLGFARRFATYKRPDLLLHDRERLLRLLTSSERPVQLVLAGKAHPADLAGQALIREWTHFIRDTAARSCVVFLCDYDMLMAERMVQGVDVWINTPRRPWEACGTSGMKVLVNGGLNVSELDGWWAEAYTPEVGWALGDSQEHGDDPAWDAIEAGALYDILEREVVPEFYARGADGVPGAWVARMRESMARLTPRFSTNRAVREYTEEHYLPAALAYGARAADKGAGGARIAGWQRALEQGFRALSFRAVTVETDGDHHTFEAQLDLATLDPEAVRVELYADGVGDAPPVRQEMTRAPRAPGATSVSTYRGQVSSALPTAAYTARVIPRHDGAAIPLEEPQILWSR
ncbi:MAG: alpha-glucan family phosphorylase [Byssovorax sp.]